MSASERLKKCVTAEDFDAAMPEEFKGIIRDKQRATARAFMDRAARMSSLTWNEYVQLHGVAFVPGDPNYTRAKLLLMECAHMAGRNVDPESTVFLQRDPNVLHPPWIVYDTDQAYHVTSQEVCECFAGCSESKSQQSEQSKLLERLKACEELIEELKGTFHESSASDRIREAMAKYREAKKG